MTIHYSDALAPGGDPLISTLMQAKLEHTRSQQLFERALLSIPGGVNSPVRAWRGVGGTPLFIERGESSHIFDADGNEYIDYVGSWGPLILGHRHPVILDALNHAISRGTSFGAPTEQEIELAETVREMFPSIEMVRLVNSGTEATMSALRVARGFTHRDLTIKFEGCYHGHVDSLLVKAGSGVATLGLPDSPGVPKGFSDTTLTVPFNNIDAVEAAFLAHRDKIAAVIVEPICGNMGCIPPTGNFLGDLRRITAENDSLLIFDEVMTGFRVAPGGAQQLYDITPDLTTLGKVIGGGLPIAAYGGRRDIMTHVAPSGPIYQAGTLSGNPLAVSAGLAAIRHLQSHPEIYDRLNRAAGALAACAPEEITVNRVGSMMTWFFTDQPVTDSESAKLSDIKRFGRFFHAMLERGIYLPPSQYEALFVSAAHTDADISHTIEAARESFAIALS
jgi:glutamate-1-semialdehyde 2,1-aminomutase